MMKPKVKPKDLDHPLVVSCIPHNAFPLNNIKQVMDQNKPPKERFKLTPWVCKFIATCIKKEIF